jgi:RND family efflux transporter MFP subunit
MGEKKGKKVMFFILAGIVLFGLLWTLNVTGKGKEGTSQGKETELVPVKVEGVLSQELDETLQVVGDLKAFQEVNVYPKIAGRIIEKIHVEKGDWVKEGQLIVSLEKDTILAQISQTEASLRAAEAKVAEVEANLRYVRGDKERFERLYKEGAIAKQRYEQIETQLRSLEASLEAASFQVKSLRSSLDLLNILLQDHSITAPMTGYVSNRYVDAGTLSDTKVPILRISQDKVLKVVANITEKDFTKLRRGMEVLVQVDAYPDRTFKGRLEVINPTLDPITRTGMVEIYVDNPDLVLRSGMFAKVSIDLGKKRCLTISKDALNRMPGTGTYYVYVVEGDRAVLKNIKTGMVQELLVEVTEGLKEGEKVVVKGQNRLRDQAKVKVVS